MSISGWIPLLHSLANVENERGVAVAHSVFHEKAIQDKRLRSSRLVDSGGVIERWDPFVVWLLPRRGTLSTVEMLTPVQVGVQSQALSRHGRGYRIEFFPFGFMLTVDRSCLDKT